MNCFSKAHIVGQDAANAALVETNHPIEAHQLIILKDAPLEDGGLLGKSGKDILIMLLLLNHVLNLLILFLKVSTLLCLYLALLAQDLMLGEKEVCIIFGLLD